MHSKDINTVINKLHTSLNGLSNTHNIVKENKGTNILKSEKKKSFLFLFLLQILNPLVYVLIAGVVLSIILKEYSDAIIIIFVIFLNAILSSIQEIKAEKAIESLKKMAPEYCIVIRDGLSEQIKVEDVVVGDVVLLNEGCKVCADMRLIESNNLAIDESSLTGESFPVDKDATLILNENTILAERKNIAYMSTIVTKGQGKGIVFATGMDTQIGKIAKMLKSAKKEYTPMEKKLNELSKVLAFVSVFLCLLIFVIAIFQKRNSLEMLITSVSLAVAIIPESLLAIVTIVLSLGMQKLAKVNAIVKKIHSVETLGCIDIVCSDKTGTLTLNKMHVEKIVVNNTIFETPVKNNEATLLANIIYYCNDACINEKGKIGDEMEISLLDFAKNYNIDKFERIDTISFDSKRKMMSILTKENQVFVKGSIDNLLPLCKRMVVNGKEELINAKLIENIHNSLAKEGLRILACAYKNSSTLEEKDLTFVGLIAIVDPPRKEAIEAIDELKKAKIKTIMITGDNKTTAFSIGKKLNIVNNEKEVITGEELDKMNSYEFNKNIDKYAIYARVTPENKLNIVNTLQKKGHIVAMTGDGVNDAPALKKADIGIAMGINGSDVSKNAADMILLDDNFSTIKKAIKQGRGIYNNIRKTILFLLSSNIGEVIVMLLAICLKFPLPLLAIHILWVNLLTDTLPSLALGQDEIDDNVMDDVPRKYNSSLLSFSSCRLILFYGFLIGILAFIAFLSIPIYHLYINNQIINYSSIMTMLNNNSDILAKARTYSFTTLALSQLFHSLGMKNIRNTFFSKKTFNNPLLFLSLLFGILIQLLVTSIPLFIKVFKTAYLEYYDWIFILLLSAIPLFVHELIILLRNNNRKSF